MDVLGYIFSSRVTTVWESYFNNSPLLPNLQASVEIQSADALCNAPSLNHLFTT